MGKDISTDELASWFGITRQYAPAFAEKHGIALAIEHNPARTRQIRRYVRADAERVYRELYEKEPPLSHDVA